MSQPLTPRAESALQLAIDLGERLFVLLFFAAFVARLSHSFAIDPYNVLAVISESLVVVLIVVRRPAKTFTMRPADWLAALAGSVLSMLVSPSGQPMLPDFIGGTIMAGGLAFAIWAKFVLRRSFGVAAANRGAVIGGPYRIVRHPMYAGYVLVYAGFLLNNPLIWNLAVYTLTLALLVARILAEERILCADPAYAGYAQRIRYRLVPGLF